VWRSWRALPGLALLQASSSSREERSKPRDEHFIALAIGTDELVHDISALLDWALGCTASLLGYLGYLDLLSLYT
jgi:hypothetical protein